MADENIRISLDFKAEKGVASIREIKTLMGQLTTEMEKAGNAGDKVKFNKLAGQIGALKNDMVDLKDKMKYADPGELLAGVTKFASGVAGGFAAVSAGFQLIAGDNKKMQEVLGKTAQVIQLLQGLESARQLLEGKGLVQGLALQAKNLFMKSTSVVVTEAQVASEIELAAAKGVAITATEAETAALAEMNTVAMMNPYVILAAAIAALVIGIGIYIYSTNEATEAEMDMQTAINNTTKATEEANKSSAKEIASTRMLLTEIGKENTTRKERQEGINELEKSYPGVLDKMTKEKLLAGDIGDATKLLTQEIYNKAKAKAYEGIVEEAVEKQLTALQKAREIRALAQDPKKAEALLKAQSGALGILIPLIDEYLPSLGLEATLTKGLVDANNELVRANRDVSIALNQAASGYDQLHPKKQVDIKDTSTIISEMEKWKVISNRINLAQKLYADELVKIKSEEDKLSENRLKNLIIVRDSEEETGDEVERKRKIRLDHEYKMSLDQRAQLDELLNQGLIAEEDYNNRVRQLDQETSDKKLENATKLTSNLAGLVESLIDFEIAQTNGSEEEQDKIRRKYSAIRKATAIADIITKTAQTVMGFWASNSGIPVMGAALAAAMSAIAVATGAAQVGIVASQKYAMGGLLVGPSHAQGGINTPFGQLEGGEGIINKKSMANPTLRNLASDINVMGGGVSFATPSKQESTPSNYITMEEAITLLNNLQVSVDEGEISRVQKKVMVTQGRSRI